VTWAVVIIFFLLLMLLSRIHAERMRNIATPHFGFEIEWPHNFTGTVLLEGEEIIAFPLKEESFKPDTVKDFPEHGIMQENLILKKRAQRDETEILLIPLHENLIKARELTLEIQNLNIPETKTHNKQSFFAR